MTLKTGYFVTGTDTEVGKTLVSGALILKLRELGRNAIGFKPVVAGTYQGQNGEYINEDIETLRVASNLPQTQSICPFVLDTPAAPHIVAKANGIELNVNKLLESFTGIQNENDFVVVEGAGGFIVPLNDHESLADFAQKIDLPIIVVVGMKLGCLNHALLTIEAIKTRKMKIAGWVANALAQEMSLLNENIQSLQDRIDAPFLGMIPTLPLALQKQNNSPYSLAALQFAAQHIQLPK
jgi:dethiobiotin synthetase